MAIGIEAFNKFSEEQKAEIEEEEGENGASRNASRGGSEDQSLCSKMSGKRILKKVAVWTSAAISSTRVNTDFVL